MIVDSRKQIQYLQGSGFDDTDIITLPASYEFIPPTTTKDTGLKKGIKRLQMCGISDSDIQMLPENFLKSKSVKLTKWKSAFQATAFNIDNLSGIRAAKGRGLVPTTFYCISEGCNHPYSSQNLITVDRKDNPGTFRFVHKCYFSDRKSTYAVVARKSNRQNDNNLFNDLLELYKSPEIVAETSGGKKRSSRF